MLKVDSQGLGGSGQERVVETVLEIGSRDFGVLEVGSQDFEDALCTCRERTITGLVC